MIYIVPSIKSTYVHAYIDLTLDIHILDMQRCVYVFGHSIDFFSVSIVDPGQLRSSSFCACQSHLWHDSRGQWLSLDGKFVSMPSWDVIPRGTIWSHGTGTMCNVEANAGTSRPSTSGTSNRSIPAIFEAGQELGKSCEMAFFYAMIQVDSVTVAMPFSRWPACSASGISGLVRKTTESPPLCTRVPRRISWDGSTFLFFSSIDVFHVGFDVPFDVYLSHIISYIWCVSHGGVFFWEPARLPSPWQVAEASTFHLWCLILR